MQKVLGINLNGRAYHVEEPGYDALVAYLGGAGTRLADNPDRAEILADLEQAIAEKCDRLLGPNKTVVTAAEIDQILVEMGPVDAGGGENAATADDAGKKTSGKDAAASPKRLYQIRERGMISGLCAGIAAYLDVDVTIVRAAFVLVTFLTKGAFLFAYGVLVFVIPYAETSEERAAARGEAFNAQAVIDRAKRQYQEFRTGKDWQRHWRRQQRHLRRSLRHATSPYAWNARASYASQVWASATAPVFGLINAALVLAMLFSLYSLTTTHAVAGVQLPEGVPLWAGIVFVLVLYQVIATPFIAMHHAATQPSASTLLAWTSPIANLVWLGAIGCGMWYGYHYVPAVHDAMDQVLTTLRGTVADLQAR
jgi:phage shock protein PspC (stress-responsive transcriptional regulator)